MKALVPYLTFDGKTRDAMTFYAKCLGAELQMSPFSSNPGEVVPGTEDRIMHASLTKGPTVTLMASDTHPGQPLTAGTNFSLSIHPESVEEIDRLFAALSENGKITMPLADAFWGARFGMFVDQFGIQWMLNYEYPKK
jgi:PhnB protein